MKWHLKQTLPYILLIAGVIGMLCAGILTVEKIELLKNPHQKLLCDLNPIVACGSVIDTWQASAFGFPNTLIGLAGFGALTTVGAALLAGARFKRWFWLGLQVGATFGIGFVTWLQYQSIFRIHALCPFCMVVWTVVIPVFIYTTLYNLQEKNLKTPKSLQSLVAFAQKHHADILIGWYLVVILLILKQFWYYWQTVL